MASMNVEKAAFRARRESIGMSQQTLAELLGVQLRTVKRWESDASRSPILPAAWGVLGEREDAFHRVVDNAVRLGIELAGRQEGPIPMPYYRTQAMADQAGHEGEPFDELNARSRAIALELRRHDIEVEYFYPIDE